MLLAGHRDHSQGGSMVVSTNGRTFADMQADLEQLLTGKTVEKSRFTDPLHRDIDLWCRTKGLSLMSARFQTPSIAMDLQIPTREVQIAIVTMISIANQR